MDGLGGEYGLGGKCIVAGAVSKGPIDDEAAIAFGTDVTILVRLAGGAETSREFIAGAAPIDDDALAGALSGGVSRPGVALAGAVCAGLSRGAETRCEFIAGAASAPIDDEALAGAVVLDRKSVV